jgi:hypothetical protein
MNREGDSTSSGGSASDGATKSTSSSSGDQGDDDGIADDQPAGERGGGECVSDAPAYDQAKMRAHLSHLASKELAGRAPGTPGDLAARKYIADRFRCLGVEPGGDTQGSYFQNFVDSEGTKSVNVVGVIRGSDPSVGADIIVLGSHLDHFGTVGDEGLRLGANDNASGITSVLTIAQAVKQAVKQTGKAPRRTMAFMVFGSEEIGCEGSHIFVDHSLPTLPMSRVVYDLNFDMVGTYNQNGKKVDAHGTLPNTPAAPLIKSLIASSFQDLNVNVGVDGLGEDDSDYSPFCLAGVPIVAFFTDDPQCYHKACDTSDRIDYPNLSRITKLGGDLAQELANTPTDLAAFRKQAKVANLGCGNDDDD